ncbi:MAG: M48 family metalloprotease [Candidatus Eremiobacteraeota bacterium]|nr:M48 family metalloprotease [Candidatus Eremiobacteraeota bacterium]MBV8263822.1 M48 family metalloprotease [Candidatus Eremiobacteraeota bacterium]MBV8338464.1 M48 family metalloprotease [Candidatus Eremiobacteraeota bacterium]MBV8668192.1 M48 family metalloprotease [Candidatus Eremiobacteraeota bacterium]
MRLIALVLAALLLWGIASPIAPAAAMSTAKEVALGAGISKEIDDENVLITDPFLVNWVNGVGGKLAANRYRQDINYQFEILDTDEVNAFALPGGFMHADMGLLNFVGSDDELAAVLGHEMGHVERRHVVTLQEKQNILGILIGVISILSPIAAALGGYGGDLVAYKFSRQDELQADQYGLLLMTRAGYDPQGAVDLMAHLGKLEADEGESRADKAMEDHPPPADRIAHLQGYPELDNPPASQIIEDAIHDQSEGRYAYARARFALALSKAPGNTLALEHVKQIDIAMKESGPPGMLHERSVAYTMSIDAFSLGDIATRIAKAQAIATDDARLAAQRARGMGNDLRSLNNQLNEQQSGIPNLGSPKKKGNNLSLAIDGLNRLTRDINGVLDNSSDVLSSAPGLAADNLQPIKDMSTAISNGPPTEKTRALLPYYPSLAASLSEGADQFVNGVDDARASVSMGSDAVRPLAAYFAALNALDTTTGDISTKDWPRVQAALNTALGAWDEAYKMSERAANYTYGAQTRTLSANITLLDLYSSSERYAAYKKAMQFRFAGVQMPEYDAVLRSGITPGELGCDAWLSYETKESMSALMRTEHDGGLSCADLALGRNLMTESMEIAEGLLYEDYIEVPETVVPMVNVGHPTPTTPQPTVTPAAPSSPGH